MENRFPTTARATIADVAAYAGVAKSTVSKYLSDGNYYVSPATREKIRAAIEHLDYQPSAFAQGLSKRRTNTIGVMVASIANPFYPELVAGVEKVIEAAGYTMLLGSSGQSRQKEADLVDALIKQRVEGVVVTSATMHDREVARLVEAGVDVVVASRELQGELIADTVVVDNRRGGYLAAQHLRDHGHTTATLVTGPLDVVAFQHRAEGFRAVYGEGKGTVLMLSNSDMTTAVDPVADLLAGPERPSAVLAASDTIALGVMTAATTQHLGIPRDLAVIGFDNIWVSQVPNVGLATIEGHAHRVGTVAAERLVDRITSRRAAPFGPPPPPERVVINADLVRRASCGCSSAHTVTTRRGPSSN
ncbi:hypothetical protein CTZ28_36650 [Streptomyces shenzhenensis]|uniref:HTH lacI-type domain-containing protein n=1 Tax=Streptomyces shenzhenensis TaxID=943815 RepID=A0A3M0I309_9ACTN|nr:hypothetical protein CTZ28_36650 [Streptomyces shenzhenensis]